MFHPFVPDVAHRTTGEILAHPDYARIRPLYIAKINANNAADKFPGGWPAAAYRYTAVCVIVKVYAGFEPDDRSTWPTLAKVKETASAFGQSSHRQLDDVVGRLVATGHIILECPAADRRLRFLRPTEKLLAWDREQLCAYYDILQLLYPDSAYDIATRRDSVFHLAHRRCAPKIMTPIIRNFLQQNHKFLPFLQMNHGANVMRNLALAASLNPENPIRETEFVGSMMKLGVSRSHIRNIITLANESEMVVRSGGRQKLLDMTPLGFKIIDRFIGDTLSSHDLSFNLAKNWLEKNHPVKSEQHI
ncbi:MULTISPECIES: hypothetical protein [Methylobacterium]|uniref:hypothetical protein n=1 Tax=Methylobacterium TaxID=407 RepID=UPI001FF07C7F|nr:hypothetical protein [Methylobacterium sp. DB0501]